MASHLARLTKLHAEVKLKHINPMYNGEHRHRKSQFSSSAVTVLPKISHR